MPLLPLNSRLERIGQHIVRARLFLDLWFYFEERASRRKIIDTMREYNEFFRFTPHAYLATYVIYMAGVFDKGRGTISLAPLIREVKVAGHLKAQDAAIVDALLAKAKPIADKVAILRHKAFAHRSAHISYNDVFKMAAVKPDELRELTDMALKITNRLLLAGPILHRASPRSGPSHDEGVTQPRQSQALTSDTRVAGEPSCVERYSKRSCDRR